MMDPKSVQSKAGCGFGKAACILRSDADEINGRGETLIIVRQVKYLNNIVEQDHRAIKRVTRPMLNFKSFRSAKNVLAGIELMHMI